MVGQVDMVVGVAAGAVIPGTQAQRFGQAGFADAHVQRDGPADQLHHRIRQLSHQGDYLAERHLAQGFQIRVDRSVSGGLRLIAIGFPVTGKQAHDVRVPVLDAAAASEDIRFPPEADHRLDVQVDRRQVFIDGHRYAALVDEPPGLVHRGVVHLVEEFQFQQRIAEGAQRRRDVDALQSGCVRDWYGKRILVDARGDLHRDILDVRGLQTGHRQDALPHHPAAGGLDG